MSFFTNGNRAAIVYLPKQGYMVVTSWMNGTGGDRYPGDHHVTGNDRLPMLSVEGGEIYPNTDAGRIAAFDHCMFLNDKAQLPAEHVSDSV